MVPETAQSAAEREHERGRRIAQGLVNAGVALSSAISLEELLQLLADSARELVDARYAALGVINPEKTGLSEFITSGLTPEQRARLGDLPTGHGILGLLITDARPIRLRDLRDHPKSAGVPPNHPEMRSFLGVPVRSKGEVFGNLYVTEKIGAPEFDDDDLVILEMLASQAAVAIENAQLRRERDRFFAAASHELGNMIASVRLWANQLLRRQPAELTVWKEGVEHIRTAAESAGRLIDDILSLSKLREGRLELDVGSVGLYDILRDTVDQHRYGAESAGLTLRLVDASSAVVVRADRTRVRQILANLLGNAIKFTPAGGVIELGAGMAEGGFGTAWVRDTGPGIAPEDQERIFRPYEQVAGIARGRGVGLGLSLSRQLARSMGGDLTVESKLGAGSTFTLRLPLETTADPAS